ncbi:cupin domain-containing protein [Streptomyces sp. NPDC056227]|uniref:cupin domain-containing protein n=1 Tax=Streptomyces sp. NPDC056227 TaxID=3345753 RepID=UPI0035D65DF3
MSTNEFQENPAMTVTAAYLPARATAEGLLPDGPPPAYVTYEGEPNVRVRPLHTPEGGPATLIWAADADSAVVVTDATVAETMHIIEGRAKLTDSDGRSFEIGPGDVLVMPKGWSGRIDTLEFVRKVIVVG